MLLCLLARLDDWEVDSYAGYVSSVSQHGDLLTYGTFYKSYVNSTVEAQSTLLFDGTAADSILTAVYGKVQITVSQNGNAISLWQNYTDEVDSAVLDGSLRETKDNETKWRQITITNLTTSGATYLYFYKNFVATIQSKNARISKLEWELNEYNESVVSNKTNRYLTPTLDKWTFLSVDIEGNETACIFYYGDDKFFYLSCEGGSYYGVNVTVPGSGDFSSFKILTTNSSEFDNHFSVQLSNLTILIYKVMYTVTNESKNFTVEPQYTIDLNKDVFPNLDLADINTFYGRYMYVVQQVLLFGTTYLCFYPRIPDDSIYYMETDEDKDIYTIYLIRAADKQAFFLTVDNAPVSLYSNGYHLLYLMGSYDNSQSGFFTIDMNHLLLPFAGQLMSCWAMREKINAPSSTADRYIEIRLKNNDGCVDTMPQAMSFCDLVGCLTMELLLDDRTTPEEYYFGVQLDHECALAYEIQVLGAVGKDADGFLINQISMGIPIKADRYICSQDTAYYDPTLEYNLLILTIKGNDSCSYDTPIIYAEAQTYLKQKVQLKLMTAVSPKDQPVYMYFFDPGDETFAGDVDFKFYVYQISPFGSFVGDYVVVDFLVETTIDSCWNFKKYLGMSYNGDHFELLLQNLIWQERTDPICDQRIDDMPELKVEFSYKNKKKRKLTLDESDFVVLENGRWAYFLEFDIYEDWVSETVILDTDGEEVTPYVGDAFELSGSYPIQFVEPDSCFEFMELIRVEYDDDNHAYVKVDRYYWCKPDQTDPEYSVVVYALNYDPDQGGDYPYCNMTYVPKENYYENRDCELEIGFVVNFTVYKMDSYINEHDEYEEDEIIEFTTLVTVTDSRYDYTYIILVSVFSGVLILVGAGFIVYWYVKKYKPAYSDEKTPFYDSTPYLPPVSLDGTQDLPAPPRPERQKRNIFGYKKKRDKAFDEELFSAIPAPPTKK